MHTGELRELWQRTVNSVQSETGCCGFAFFHPVYGSQQSKSNDHHSAFSNNIAESLTGGLGSGLGKVVNA
jgi:hypothetical protein